MKISKVSRLWPILILIGSYGYIFFKFNSYNWNTELKIHLSGTNILQLSIIQIILLFFNLSCEALKWRILISPIEKISYKKSFKMILAGYTSGIFTPGKLGEPIGRNLFIKQNRWIETAALNYYGGMIQNSIIFFVAFISSLIIYIYEDIPWIKTILQYSMFLIGIFIIAILLIYYNKYRLKHLFEHAKIRHKVIQIKKVMNLLTYQLTIRVILLNFLRYLFFCSQLIIMFYFLGPDQFKNEIILFTPIYYLGITMIPSFVLADLGIRNSVALFLFTYIHQNTYTIVVCVSLLWIINQCIPALTGSVFFLKKTN